MQRKAYTEPEILTRLGEMPGWALVDGALQKEFKFADFVSAFAFLTRLAIESEKMDHHAEIWNVYNRVRIRLNTHDSKGITDFDFALAQKLDASL